MFLPKILSTSAPIYVNTFKSISGQFWECKAFWYSLLDQLRTLNDGPLQMDLTLHIFEMTLWCMKTLVLDLESYFLLITNHYIVRSNTCVWRDLTNCRVFTQVKCLCARHASNGMIYIHASCLPTWSSLCFTPGITCIILHYSFWLKTFWINVTSIIKSWTQIGWLKTIALCKEAMLLLLSKVGLRLNSSMLSLQGGEQ
jgi:hypothetical protein